MHPKGESIGTDWKPSMVCKRQEKKIIADYLIPPQGILKVLGEDPASWGLFPALSLSK
jgi:hypothetical protein